MARETIGELRLEMLAEGLLSQLGEPGSQGELQLWGADGRYYQDWYYPQRGLQIKLSASTETGDLRVASLTLQSPSLLKTQHNIGIGNTWEQVEAAYGDVIEAESSQAYQQLVAGSIYGGLIFSFENGQVSQIFLGAATE
ncbi:MAG: hypothetical protein AAGC54_05200 [Cyanobacteria bacterium P01_F01_bin.4]